MSKQSALSDEQERMRLEGLRILARIIARHTLAHPDLYEDDTEGGAAEPARLDGQSDSGRPPDVTDDAA